MLYLLGIALVAFSGSLAEPLTDQVSEKYDGYGDDTKPAPETLYKEKAHKQPGQYINQRRFTTDPSKVVPGEVELAEPREQNYFTTFDASQNHTYAWLQPEKIVDEVTGEAMFVCSVYNDLLKIPAYSSYSYCCLNLVDSSTNTWGKMGSTSNDDYYLELGISPKYNDCKQAASTIEVQKEYYFYGYNDWSFDWNVYDGDYFYYAAVNELYCDNWAYTCEIFVSEMYWL